jgi:hypothetical protein
MPSRQPSNASFAAHAANVAQRGNSTRGTNPFSRAKAQAVQCATGARGAARRCAGTAAAKPLRAERTQRPTAPNPPADSETSFHPRPAFTPARQNEPSAALRARAPAAQQCGNHQQVQTTGRSHSEGPRGRPASAGRQGFRQKRMEPISSPARPASPPSPPACPSSRAW